MIVIFPDQLWDFSGGQLKKHGMSSILLIPPRITLMFELKNHVGKTNLRKGEKRNEGNLLSR
jgi:hypothetical protein